MAVIAICFIVAPLGTNFATYSISAGADSEAIFPRFISMCREGYVRILVSSFMVTLSSLVPPATRLWFSC